MSQTKYIVKTAHGFVGNIEDRFTEYEYQAKLFDTYSAAKSEADKHPGGLVYTAAVDD